MITPNRDLLVLTGKITMNPGELEHQVKLLNDLLFRVESMNVFCTANEVIDINSYRIIYSRRTIQNIIRQKTLKPFVFICNKN